MDRKSLEALQVSSAMGAELSKGFYEKLRVATATAMQEEGVALEDLRIQAAVDAKNKEDEQQRLQALKEQQEKSERINNQIIARATSLLPAISRGTGGRGGNWFETDDIHTMHGLLDTVAWTRTVEYGHVYPYQPHYIVGYSYLTGGVLLALSNESGFRHNWTWITTFRPLDKKQLKAFKAFNENDASIFDPALATQLFSPDKNCYVVSAASPGVYLQPIRKDKYGWLVFDKYEATTYGSEGLPTDVFRQYNVDHWLARLTARFGVDEQYQVLLKELAETEFA